MPRYRYQCTECNNIVMVFHLISETYTDCEKCTTDNSLKKMLTMPLKLTPLRDKRASIGDITKDHIMANTKILEEEKQKAKSETYEPS